MLNVDVLKSQAAGEGLGINALVCVWVLHCCPRYGHNSVLLELVVLLLEVGASPQSPVLTE